MARARGADVTTHRYPAVEGLFTWPSDEPRLIGGRCGSCATYCFPSFAERHAPDCDAAGVEEALLGAEGTLIAYTIQRYPPPPPFVSPDPFVPMAVGTVALPEGIQLPGQLKDVDHDALAVGMPVRVVIDTLFVDDDGGEALTWWFEPA